MGLYRVISGLFLFFFSIFLSYIGLCWCCIGLYRVMCYLGSFRGYLAPCLALRLGLGLDLGLDLCLRLGLGLG